MRLKTLFYLVVIALACLAVLAVWKFNQRPNDALFKSTYPGYAYETAEDAWYGGILAYREGRWEEAAEELERFPDNTEAMYFRALSLMELEREAEAEPLWEVVRHNDPDYYADATWHLALTCLKLDRIDEGYLLLEELQRSPDPIYSAKATAFIEAYLKVEERG